MDDITFWLIAITASIMVGLSKGGLPIIAMASVPLLSIVMPPLQAAGLLLPIYVISDAFGLWAYRRDFNKRILLILVPATALGVFLGWLTATWVSERWVEGAIGLLGAVFAADRLLRRPSSLTPQEPKIGKGLFWGAAAGFTSFVTHAGGPPYQIYVLPLNLSKSVFAGTSTILFAWVNFIKLPAYWSLGLITPSSLPIALWLMPIAALAVFAGIKLVKVMPEKLFFSVVLWALLLLSLRMIWAAATS